MSSYIKTGQTLTDRIAALKTRVGHVRDMVLIFRETLRRNRLSLPIGLLEEMDRFLAEVKAISNDAEETERQLAALKAIIQNLHLFYTATDRDELLNRVTEDILIFTGAERIYFFIGGTQQTGPNAVAWKDKTGEVETPSAHINQHILRDTLTSGQAMVADNWYGSENSAEPITQRRLRSVMCVSLQKNARIVGAVYIDRSVMQGGFFRDHNLELVEMYSQHLNRALDRL